MEEPLSDTPTVVGNDLYMQKYTDSNFTSQFLTGLVDLKNAGKFFDMNICVGSTKIPCHRIVLAAASDYFRSMFGGTMKESFTNTVTIHDVEPSTMECLVDFCYTGSVVVTEDNVTDLLKASDVFQFPTVRESCCEFLGKKLHPSNCISIHNYAESHSCTQLVKTALTFIASNIVEVTEYPEFLTLGYDIMRQIMSHSEVNVDKEENVYEILLYWLRDNISTRSESFCRLMECVRLPFIRRIYLLSKIETNPLIRKSSLCQRLVKETRMFHTCMLDLQDNASIRLQPRPSTGIAELLIMVGGCDENCDQATSIEAYNPITDSWRRLAQFEGNLRGGYAIVTLGNDIYVTGGSQGSQVYSRVWRYNSQVSEWSEVAPMLLPKEYHGSVVLNSFIYVVGASGCECYDFLLDRWTMIASLPHPVTNCSVTSCLGKIYSIGNAFNSEEMIIQVYSPETDSWSVLPCPLPQMNFVPHITSLKGLVYFIREDSTEVLTYDPTSFKWSKIPPMLQLHLGGSAAVFNGSVIVSGGYDEQFGLAGTIEAYDPDKKAWSVIGMMPRPMFWHGCVSIYRFVSTPTGLKFTADADLHDLTPLLKPPAS
uniref:Kelch-like protein 21 n=1 Tax=Phallusia mammillata TaxID=59560 RepID=A0A6F9DGX1_9ASCI|nr:kelch-like protein 21 [Phallusia mammillata]